MGLRVRFPSASQNVSKLWWAEVLVRVRLPFWLQLKLCCMHQCDYCCWYNPAGYCDCPLVMRKKACKSAIKTKERTESKVITSKAVNNEDL